MAGEMTRRSFLQLSAAAFAHPLIPPAEPVRFGVIADVHHGLAKRTEDRLSDFLQAASSRVLDFILQLGDFNHPVPEAGGFLKLWHSYRGPRFGVLGNHDMDMGSKAQALEGWELRRRFYSFDAGFLHFVVLDANFMKLDGKLVPYEKANWYRGGITASWIDPEQLEWLRSDLEAASKPAFVFVHQGIDELQGGGAVPNRAEVRKVMEDSGKVCACFQGHHHVDVDEIRNRIYYLRVNSASYAWVGERYGRMADYDRSLYAFATVWPDGKMEIEGRRGLYEGESPFSRGVPHADMFSSSLKSRTAELALRNPSQLL